MTDRIRVYAGDCTAEYVGTVNRTARGRVVALVKPDNTVLIHDREGYSPAVWLTRPGSLDIDHSERPQITAVDGDQRLSVRFHELEGRAVFPVSVAGVPVGLSGADASDDPYVRHHESVVNLTTGGQYSLPRSDTVIDARCRACGLPLVRVDRETDHLRCLDPGCDTVRQYQERPD